MSHIDTIIHLPQIVIYSWLWRKNGAYKGSTIAAVVGKSHISEQNDILSEEIKSVASELCLSEGIST